MKGTAASRGVEELWDAFSQDLLRFIARRVRRPEDAEDILQSVFLRIQAKLATVEDDDRLLGWMYTLTRNAITDHYRLASNRREIPTGEVLGENSLAAALDAEDENAAEVELGACLRPMLAELSEDQAAALELVDFRGMSQVEAAAIAGISISGMKSRVQRGRAHLRSLVLGCCTVSLDVRGRVQEFSPRSHAGCPGC